MLLTGARRTPGLIPGVLLLLAVCGLVDHARAHRIAYDPLKDPDYWEGVSAMSPIDRLAFKEYVQSKINGIRHMVIPEFVHARLKAEASSTTTPPTSAPTPRPQNLMSRSLKPTDMGFAVVDSNDFIKVTPDMSKRDNKVLLRIAPETNRSQMLRLEAVKLVDQTTKRPDPEMRIAPLKYPQMPLYNATPKPNLTQAIVKHFRKVQNPTKMEVSKPLLPAGLPPGLPEALFKMEPATRHKELLIPVRQVEVPPEPRTQMATQLPPVAYKTEDYFKAPATRASNIPVQLLLQAMEKQFRNHKDSNQRLNSQLKNLYSMLATPHTQQARPPSTKEAVVSTTYPELNTYPTVELTTEKEDKLDPIIHMSQRTMDFMNELLKKKKFEFPESISTDPFFSGLDKVHRVQDKLSVLQKPDLQKSVGSADSRVSPSKLVNDINPNLVRAQNTESALAMLMKNAGQDGGKMLVEANNNQQLPNLVLLRHQVENPGPGVVSQEQQLLNPQQMRGPALAPSPALGPAPGLAPAPSMVQPPPSPMVPSPALAPPPALAPLPAMVPPAMNYPITSGYQLPPQPPRNAFLPGQEQGALQYQEVPSNIGPMEVCPPGAVCSASMLKGNKWYQEQMSSYQNEDLNGVLSADWNPNAPQGQPPIENLVFNPIPVYYRETGQEVTTRMPDSMGYPKKEEKMADDDEMGQRSYGARWPANMEVNSNSREEKYEEPADRSYRSSKKVRSRSNAYPKKVVKFQVEPL